MNGTRCKLCRAPSDLSYEVQRDKPVPLCSRCFGSWQPHELNSLLGVTPDVTATVSNEAGRAHGHHVSVPA